MVTSIPDSQGRIIAYCEWRNVGASGFDVLNGAYVWVNDLWVHPDHRHSGIISQIIDTILWKAPHAKFGYFKRKKYNDRIRIWTRENFMKLAKQMECV